MRFQDITSNILCKAAPKREELESRIEHGFNKFLYDNCIDFVK